MSARPGEGTGRDPADIADDQRIMLPLLRLAGDLVVRRGYGGSRREAGEAVGRAGDGGIDGIVEQDRLGLDVIYVQAKRWEDVVGRPGVQRCAGALQGQRATNGILLATARFSRATVAYVACLSHKIMLIDGARLADLMIDRGVGGATEAVCELKWLDSEYCADDR